MTERLHGQRTERCTGKIGTSNAPCVVPIEVETFIPPQEKPEFARLIDWAWGRERLDDGGGVGFVVDPADSEALRDAIAQRIDWDLIIRSPEPGVLQVCRPWALE